jgi:hypothetical protein
MLQLRRNSSFASKPPPFSDIVGEMWMNRFMDYNTTQSSINTSM